MRAFAAYARTCSDEKGEAQVFCDRMFRAFGHAGYKEAGAVLEDRMKVDGKTRFGDLVWKPRAVVEMKKRGEKLSRHYAQVLAYWLYATPNRPRYAVLCNFEEFWIYDFEQQMDEPMDRVALDELPDRFDALNFMFPEGRPPNFQNNRTAVTDDAAKKIAGIFRSLTARGEPRERAQRFTLQCVVAMFAEDSGLLPKGLFTELVTECLGGRSSYDLLGSLFAQMNNPRSARAGRFKLVPYFNGGIFATVDPIELNAGELFVMNEACMEHWGQINPAIFGTLFQASMDDEELHEKGAHYTPESAIMRVVLPTIVQPLRERIEKAETLTDLKRVRDALTRFRVLDPACGSGNFLYVAYRELKRLELQILERIHEGFARESRLSVGRTPSIKIKQFYGIDTDPFAVELAKVTMVLAKKLAIDEQYHALDTAQAEIEFDQRPLPLENLDENILQADALFSKWPKADVIIGNPPFQSKTKMHREFGPEYVQRVRARFPEVSGRADYCVYWFRRAHDELSAGGRAGLVGTNTIRQNFSRQGGLDYIAEHGGTITDAVSTQVWPGRAVVHVSIVNWIKGKHDGKKRLLFQVGDHADSPWREAMLDRIPTSLSDRVDVTQAKSLTTNEASKSCYQGLTHGHEGFLLEADAARLLRRDRRAAAVIHPYLNGDQLLAGNSRWRYLIDLSDRMDLLAARSAGSDVLSGTPYRAIRRIGRGSMGVVIEAEHRALGHRVAVKLLGRAHGDLADRIRVEAQVLARIRHPNLLEVVDFGATPTGRPYFVAELLRGRSLLDELEERGHLELTEAAAILRQVMAGLSCVHVAGIVHRDLKPENVFLCDDGAVKVLDFGLAKIFDATADPRTPSPTTTDHGVVVGTPAYMAPEQIVDGLVDARTDVYAAGALLYFMVAGVRPFDDAETSDAVMESHVREALDVPEASADATCAALERVGDVFVRVRRPRRQGHGPAGRSRVAAAAGEGVDDELAGEQVERGADVRRPHRSELPSSARRTRLSLIANFSAVRIRTREIAIPRVHLPEA